MIKKVNKSGQYEGMYYNYYYITPLGNVYVRKPMELRYKIDKKLFRAYEILPVLQK